MALDGMRWQEVFGGIDSVLRNDPVITKVDTEEQTINSTTGNFITIMHVTSTDNSYIESITCQSWNSYSSTPYVTVESMIKATKGIMSLEIKQPGNDNKIKTEK